MRHFQEEKLSLGLFHHQRLDDYWKEKMGRAQRTFKRVVPELGLLMSRIYHPVLYWMHLGLEVVRLTIGVNS